MATMENTSTFIGTELKLNINIEPIGNVTMDDYDFEVDVYCSVKRVLTIKKSDAIRIDQNNYVILVDTAQTGAGELKCKITAYILDEDFKDAFRTEVVGLNTGITIIKQI